jgi:hypothetical protein
VQPIALPDKAKLDFLDEYNAAGRPR